MSICSLHRFLPDFILFEIGVIICLVLIQPATAVISIETPGQKVYLNETIDISKVLSWHLQFAWWEGWDGVSHPNEFPDEIYDAGSFQHKYYLDSTKFKVGRYFKWDGIYEPDDFTLAFEIRPGTRPKSEIPEGNYTEILLGLPTPPAKEIPKDTHAVIARYDEGTLRYGLDTNITGSHPQGGFIWLFGGESKVLGEPMKFYPNDSVYSYEFTPRNTEDLREGWYTGYLQFAGNNGWQDVFYNSSRNALDSPYKGVNPVNLDPFLPARIQSEFELMAKPSRYSDDMLIPITAEIKIPEIIFTEYYEEEDNITIGGHTSLSDGTNISFMIDPDRWFLQDEIASHTFYIIANGTINQSRYFKAALPIDWNETAIGWHTIQAKIEKNKINVIQNIDFRVTDIFIMPTPAPIRERVVVEDYGWHHLNAQNNTAILTANMTNVTTLGNETILVAIPITPEVPTIESNETTNITTVQTLNTPPPEPVYIPPPGPPTIAVPLATTTIILAVAIVVRWRGK